MSNVKILKFSWRNIHEKKRNPCPKRFDPNQNSLTSSKE